MSKDALSYRFVGLKRFDNFQDKILLKLALIKGNVTDLYKRIKHIEGFLQDGPHGSAWRLFNEMEKE